MGGRRKDSKGPHRRDVQGAEGILDKQEKEHEEQGKIVQCLICTTQHFFGGFSALFCGVADPRNPKNIYSPKVVRLGNDQLLPMPVK